MTAEVLSDRVGLGIRAVLALLLGLAGVFMVVLAAFMPRTSAILVVQLFACYALLGGLLCILVAARAKGRVMPRGLMGLEGLVEVGTSATAFIIISGHVERRPGGLLALIAVWAIVTGTLELAWTFTVDLQRGRLLLAAIAAVSVAFGVSLLGWRPPDLMSAVSRLAVYALLLGGLRLVATFWLRGPGLAETPSVERGGRGMLG